EDRLKEDPRGLTIRTDDPRVGAADNRAQVESDPEPEIGPAGHGRGHSNPRPTMLMKTSSRVGSVLRRAWTLAPWAVIALRTSATGASFSKMNVSSVRFFEASSRSEKFTTPFIRWKVEVS